MLNVGVDKAERYSSNEKYRHECVSHVSLDVLGTLDKVESFAQRLGHGLHCAAVFWWVSNYSPSPHEVVSQRNLSLPTWL